MQTGRTALIVHAHPEQASFSSAQARAAADGLRAAGYRVDLLDLYALDWAPVLGPGEFPDPASPFKPQAEQVRALAEGTVDPLVRDHLDRVLAADLLVFSFPLWWFSVPAVLKGWLDRVLMMGGVFGGDHGVADEAATAGKDAVLLLTTGGDQAWFSEDGFGSLDGFLYHLHRGVMAFLGLRPLEPVVTFAPARMSEEARAAALEAVGERFSALTGVPA
ncbi:NAD(P)H-dependent oxidoreductase [Actinokineospora bangkokensis]|uniref:NAD(P)H dehydrogenase n=1 Tax=Actinokineospora bangkokensis TaxID=1193682 RepID=A0A1Q9LS02_9PSEU|nr:NAD(P)H-dependent oxidoreductase [Actinokineospora bangkokensis]OLR94793.1 NAD(P)H dehydrogenase [Actinokineospora bangkokensis]